MAQAAAFFARLRRRDPCLIPAYGELSNPYSIVLYDDNRTTFQLIRYAIKEIDENLRRLRR